jgi:hypothetical protein
MKIELKKISFNERMSEETNCFVADLYINGKNVGECKNEGHGGCTWYRGNSKEANVLIQEAEAYCKTLPKVKWKDKEWEQSLESYIDEQLEAYLKAKFETKARKKFEKLQEKSIVWGKHDTYGNMHLPYSVPLSHVAKVQPQKLQERVNAIKEKYCTGTDVVILNTNLTELGISI